MACIAAFQRSLAKVLVMVFGLHFERPSSKKAKSALMMRNIMA